MRLYYFTTLDFGLQAIRDKRLKLARIQELNDPFEFLGYELRDKTDRRAMNNWKEEMSERFGMTCFSSGWKHPLLWGHYAEKHKGLCLGFDVPDDDTFTEVRYLKERMAWPVDHAGRRVPLNEANMKDLIYSKFEGWGYESEWRRISRLEDADPVTDLYFTDFGDELKLSEIIVGARSNLTVERLTKVLGTGFAQVKVQRAKVASKSFDVVPSKAAWL